MRRQLTWVAMWGAVGLLAGGCGVEQTEFDLGQASRGDSLMSQLNASPTNPSINEGDTQAFSLDVVCNTVSGETQHVSWDFGTAGDTTDQLTGTVLAGTVAGGNCSANPSAFDADWSSASDPSLQSPSWVYGQDGSYLGIVTVTDTTPSTQSQYIFVEVANVAPIAYLTPPSGTLYEGVSLNFDGSVVDPGLSDNEISFVSWWWGDGDQEEAFDCTDATDRAAQSICTGASASERAETRSHVFVDNGSYRVYLRVCDDSLAAPDPTFGGGTYPPGTTPPPGCSDTYADVTVQNAVPTPLPINSAASVSEGEDIMFTGAYTDNGADSHYIRWDFDDTEPGTNTSEGTADTIATRPDPDPAGFNPATVLTPTTSYCNVGAGSESRTITFEVTDDDVGYGKVERSITVNDIDPVVSLDLDSDTVGEGGDIAFSASIDTLSACDPIDMSSFVWSCGGTPGTDSAVVAGCGSADPVCICHYFDGPNTFTASLTVSDEDSSTTVTREITVNNLAPVVLGPEDTTVAEGQNIAFDGSYTDAAGSYDSYTVTWDFGDGDTWTRTTLPYGNADAPEHHYLDAGTYLASLTVADEDGGTTPHSFAVTVSEVQPVIQIVGTTPGTTIDEGGSVSIQVTAVSGAPDVAADDPITSYDYDWGDGTSSTDAGTNPSHVYVENGTYTVTISVNDETTDSDAPSTTTLEITVNNVRPDSVTITSPANNSSFEEGETISFAGSFEDPSMHVDGSDTRAVDSFFYEWDFGDGTSEPGTVDPDGRIVPSVDHIYADQGHYQVSISVRDDDMAVDDWVTFGDFFVDITDVAPVISDVSAQEINEGSDTTITVTATTGAADGSSDPLAVASGYEFDCDGNGDFTDPDDDITDGPTGSCHFVQDGTFTVNVRVHDEDSYSDSSVEVTVNNVAPVISLPSPAGPINETDTFTFADASFADPGADTWTAWWTFSDPKPIAGGEQLLNLASADVGAGGLPETSYTFADDQSLADPQTVVCARLHVEDDDAETISDCYDVTLRNTDPTFFGDEVRTTSPVGEGTAMNFFVSAEDLGGLNDQLTYTYVWGDSTPNTVLTGQTFAAHIFSGEGNFMVTVTVTDDDGGSVSKDVDVQVINIPPEIVDVLQTGPKDENSQVSVTPILKSYNVGVLEYRFDWDGTGFNGWGADQGWVPSSVGLHTYPNQGTFPVNVEVRDDATPPGVSASSAVVVINNVAPVVSISAPPPVDEGQAGSIAVTANDVGPDDTLSFKVDWEGNGSYVDVTPTGANPYILASPNTPDDGTFPVRVRVYDDLTYTEVMTTVQVNNVAPVIGSFTATPGVTVAEGTTVSFAVAASDVAGAYDPLTYSFDFNGDGTFDMVTDQANVDHNYVDNGVFEARVRVSDGDGGQVERPLTITVNNVAPVISDITLAPAPANEGDTVVLTVTASDVGNSDVLTYAFDFDNDGSFEVQQGSNVASHLFASDGSFPVNVRVSDADGGSDTDSVTVVVNNLEPVIDSVVMSPADGEIDEGDVVTVQVNASDAGHDSLTYEFDWMCDGEYETVQSAAIATHVYADANEGAPFAVCVQVRDADGAVTQYSGSLNVTVNNLTPSIDSLVMAPASGAIDEGDSLMVNVTALGGDGSLSYSFDWDGSGSFGPEQNAGVASHVYMNEGSYDAVVRVMDEDGEMVTQTFSVVVSNVAPVIDAIGSTSPVTAGSAVTLTVSAHDTANDSLTYAFAWDNVNYEAASASNIGFHTFDASGSYTIGVRVSDGTDSVDGSVGVTVTDSSISLVVMANPPQIVEGASAAVRVTPSGTGPYLVSWDWNGDGLYSAGDGDTVDVAFDASGSAYVEQSHSFADNGQYRVNVRVVDQGSGNAVAASSTSVQVNNVDPTFTSSSPAVTAVEGQSYSYTFAASDVAADTLTFSLVEAPAGVSIDSASGLLTWTPIYQQAGAKNLSVNVQDDDGGFATYAWQVTVTVVDSDNDGMPDAWEIENFGDLTSAGSDTDSDGDGVSDVDEFNAGTNPDASDYNAPSAPVALRPIDKYVAELMPTLVVNNASDPDVGDTLTYSFEIYDNADYSGTAVMTAEVNEGEGTTSWAPETELTDGTKYWWRCLANDGVFDSPYSEDAWFVVSVANNAPATPILLLPVDGSMVSSLLPTVELRSVSDPDMDAVTYDFEIYDDSAMAANDLVGSAQGQAQVYWTVASDLEEDVTYFWRARAVDDQGAASDWSGLFSFTVNTAPPANTAPEAPVVVLPEIDSTVTTLRPYFEVSAAVDADGDALTYAFTVYSDAALNTEVAAVTGRTLPTWFLDADLQDGAEYWWTATANDGQDSSELSNVGHFTVALPVVVVNTAPSAPSIEAPAQGAVVNNASPTLTVGNAEDAEGDALSYYFELADNAGFSGSSVQVSAEIDEDTDSTSWDGLNTLEEDTMYFWRVRASDGELMSEWVVGSFTVNAVNAAPSVPTPLNPSDGALLQDAPVYLVAQNAMDAEGDALTYTFEIAADDQGSEILGSANDVVEGEGSTRWAIADVVFAPGSTYFWRVRARDGAGDGEFSEWVSFTLYKAPVIPDTTPSDGGGDSASGGGCGCSSNSPQANAGLLMLGLLGLALIRRRR